MAFGDLGFHLCVPIVQVPARVSHPFTELPGHCVVVVPSRVGFIAPEEGRVGSGSRAPAQGKRTGGKEAFRELGPEAAERKAAGEADAQDNEIGDEGAKALAEAVASSECKLHTLELGRNGIGAEGAKALAEAVASSECKLHTLYLQGE
ncbi:hypothetical protein CYMTET_19882 [Cymbomonas tetramitiformis]|uniref:Uncharacterized protein n=1 Tax=Cymbomonas tetramitiformis TaxID=36881 RepID=A0AAE0G547_9CHLO|nr:hypothetical protein CYMTET_19882 [Cymbomonas tetramitiformis]